MHRLKYKFSSIRFSLKYSLYVPSAVHLSPNLCSPPFTPFPYYSLPKDLKVSIIKHSVLKYESGFHTDEIYSRFPPNGASKMAGKVGGEKLKKEKDLIRIFPAWKNFPYNLVRTWEKNI